MKKATVAALALSVTAHAHYTFPGLIYDGVTEEDWTYVRKTTNFGVHDHGPVTDVTSSQLTCYQEEPASSPNTKSVKGGDKIGFRVDGNVTHPGPLQFYMAKAPDGETAATFNGEGDVWFKIFHDDPTFTDSWPEWPNSGAAEVFVTIPTCLADGDYLLRAEHIAVHYAHFEGGAQFYIGCAQLHVSGGGSKTFEGVAFPGAYSATHPGILFDIQSRPTSYEVPGPDTVSC